MNFDPLKSRLDILMHETMSGKPAYSKLWNILRMLLVLTHIQAAVERGFLVNKQAEEVHLQRDAFVAKRSICDYVNYVDGIDQVDVTCKELLLSATSARQKYNLYRDECKKISRSRTVRQKEEGCVGPN